MSTHCRAGGAYGLVLGLASLLLISGCSSSEEPSASAALGTSSSAGQQLTASQLLERMAAAYRQAESYADSGSFYLRFTRGGQQYHDQADFSVVLQRPDKLRMHVYQGIVVVDGKYLYASIGDLPGQVLRTEASDELKLEVLFVDPILTGVLNEGIVGGSLQLALLLHDRPLDAILQGAGEPELLEPATFDGAKCQRVVARHAEGDLVFWIDEQTYVLRRFDYPVRGLEKMLSQEQPATDVQLTAEFLGARFNEKPDDVAFQFELPEEASFVERFNIENVDSATPPPPALSPLLGQQVPPFRFVTLDGEEVTRQSLAGKVVVLDFWATWCKPCLQSLPNVQKVFERYRDDERVAVLAVSIDEPEITGGQLTEMFTELGLNVPIVRNDSQRDSDRVFGAENIPSLFILGADGTVQDNEVGFNPNLAEELPDRIERVMAGESIWEESLRRYQEQMQKAQGTQDQLVELPKTSIAPEKMPENHTASKVWTYDELAQPGNILVVGSGDDARILVLDGFSTVVELDVQGKLVARHELDLPKEPQDSVITSLRTATDAGGQRYFAGSASAQQQLHLFDDEFKTLLSYPQSGSHSGIADWQLADLDGDGQLELNVSYWGTVGVQNLALDGQRRWWNRALDNVFRLAAIGPDAQGRRLLLCANGRGTLVPIDYAGQEQAERRVADRFVRAIVAEDVNGDGRQELCGISAFRAGADVLLGLDEQGGVLWNYTLPEGVQPAPAVEMLAGGNLLNTPEGQWIASGADGSLHVLGGDGKLLDVFHTGAAITGLAIAPAGDADAVLLIGNRQGVTAWRLAPK